MAKKKTSKKPPVKKEVKKAKALELNPNARCSVQVMYEAFKVGKTSGFAVKDKYETKLIIKVMDMNNSSKTTVIEEKEFDKKIAEAIKNIIFE